MYILHIYIYIYIYIYIDKGKEKITIEFTTLSFTLLRSSGKSYSPDDCNNVKLEVVNSVVIISLSLSI